MSDVAENTLKISVVKKDDKRKPEKTKASAESKKKMQVVSGASAQAPIKATSAAPAAIPAQQAQPLEQQASASASAPSPSEVRGELPHNAEFRLFRAVREAWNGYYPQHRRQVSYGFIGFLLAVGILAFGFWKVLMVAAFTFAGIVIGQYADGNPRIIVAVANFIKRHS